MAGHVVRAGMIFGKLKLIQRVAAPRNSSPNLRIQWLCECQCGNPERQKVPQAYFFREPNPKVDCGCSRKTNKTIFNQEYRIWLMMLKRTTDPRHVSFKDYGGRGIKVCAEWSDPTIGFDAFLAYIGPRPTPSHTVDRINNDLGYQPFQEDGVTRQVKWSTPVEQRANQRPSNASSRSVPTVAQPESPDVVAAPVSNDVEPST